MDQVCLRIVVGRCGRNGIVDNKGSNQCTWSHEYDFETFECLGCSGARNSTAKSVYSKLFDWLVKHINDVCLPSSASSRQKNFIGLLDIFGFERFTSNGELIFFFFFSKF